MNKRWDVWDNDIAITDLVNSKSFFYKKEYTNMVNDIVNGMHTFFIVEGKAGVGKTTLVNAVLHNVKSRFDNIYQVFKYQDLHDLTGQHSNYNSSLFYIKLEEIEPLLLQKIMTLISFKPKCVIIETRNKSGTIPNHLHENFADITKHIYLVPNSKRILDYLMRNVANNSNIISLVNIVNTTGITPFLMQLLLDFAQGRSEQVYTLEEGLVLKGANTSTLLTPEKRIMLPNKKIITTISHVNRSLVERADKEPQIIHDITPREFEELVCELLERLGMSVTLTQRTRDGGKDIIIVEESALGSFLVYCECKQHSPDRPVGVSLVRELYGTVSADNATAGLLVTTSYFTPDAKAYQQKIENRMSLMDYTDLLLNIQKVCRS